MPQELRKPPIIREPLDSVEKLERAVKAILAYLAVLQQDVATKLP